MVTAETPYLFAHVNRRHSTFEIIKLSIVPITFHRMEISYLSSCGHRSCVFVVAALLDALKISISILVVPCRRLLLLWCCWIPLLLLIWVHRLLRLLLIWIHRLLWVAALRRCHAARPPRISRESTSRGRSIHVVSVVADPSTSLHTSLLNLLLHAAILLLLC